MDNKQTTERRRQFGAPTRPDQATGPEASGFEERVIAIDRVSRTVAGGRRMRFRALVVVGNGKGKVGMGIGKGSEVVKAISKATTQARKHVIEVPIVRDTIPFNIRASFGSTDIQLKSAKPGTSIIAGGVIRPVAELAGIKNIVAKIYGSTNKITTAKAIFAGLQELTRRYGNQTHQNSRSS